MSELPAWCCASGCKKCPAWREQERERIRESIARKMADAPSRCSSCKQTDAPRGLKTCRQCIEKAGKRKRAGRPPGRCTGCKSSSVRAGFRQCDRCREERAAYKLRERAKAHGIELTMDEARDEYRGTKIDYTPIDEWLDRPGNRILRALRRFDWVEMDELAFALGIPQWNLEPIARQNLHQNVKRLFRAGRIDRRRSIGITGRPLFEYRLSQGVSVEPPMDLEVAA